MRAGGTGGHRARGERSVDAGGGRLIGAYFPDLPTAAVVLVVDDNALALLTTSAVLSGLGAEVVTASSGREALFKVLSANFAVIVLDIDMP
ncbi:MAG: response regulator [Myxococcales bacterium]|nr:response regulator [Myxococcales bacterium]